MNGSCSGSLLYTYNNLTKKDLEFFDGLSSYGRMDLSGYPSLSYCHGSMNSSRELLHVDSDRAINALEHLDTDILLCAHTHIQGTFESRGKKIINPGSVGVPWYHGGNAQFAIIHGSKDTWEEEYIQLDYDKDRLIKEYDISGLRLLAPMWVKLTAECIKTGSDRTIHVLERAKELCQEETGEMIWPNIPEKYWELAAREYGYDIEI